MTLDASPDLDEQPIPEPPGADPTEAAPAPLALPIAFARALQRGLPMAILGLAIVGAPVMMLQPQGLPRMRSLQKELAQVDDENAELRRDVNRLRAEVADLRDNPAAVERIARDQLGLVRRSEVVFHFTPARRSR